MGGRATPDDSCPAKPHKKRRRQKKAKHRGHSKSRNRRRYGSQSPSSSSLSLSSSSSPFSYSSDFDSDSKSDRVRARNKDSRSRRRREKHGSGRKRDRSGRKRDRPTPSRRLKVASKRRKLESSSKPRHETERGRQRKRTRGGRDKYVSASTSPSSDRSCSTCDSRSRSSSRSGRSSSRHGRRQSTKIEGRRNESQGAGKYDTRVEIPQVFDDLSYSHSYNSDDGVKKLDSQEAKLPSPSSRKIASLDLVADIAGRKQLEDSSADDGRSHHNSVHVKEQGCLADDDYSHNQSKLAGDAVTKLKSMVVVPATVSKDNDLELVLRQRALENLRKFKTGNASTVRSSLGVEDGQVQNRPDSPSSGRSQLGVKDKSMPEKPTQYTVQKLVRPNEKGTASASQQKCTFSLEKNFNDGTSPLGPIGMSVGRQPIQTSVSTAIGGTSSKFQHTNASNLSASILPADARHLPSGSSSVRKEGLASSNQFCSGPEGSNQYMLRQTTNLNKIVEKGSEYEPVSHGKEADATKADGPPTAAASPPGQPPCDSNEGKSNNEASAEDQLEKKTMTVMRGGEMVQVSYKVYIPKKTPALARRQLQR